MHALLHRLKQRCSRLAKLLGLKAKGEPVPAETLAEFVRLVQADCREFLNNLPDSREERNGRNES